MRLHRRAFHVSSLCWVYTTTSGDMVAPYIVDSFACIIGKKVTTSRKTLATFRHRDAFIDNRRYGCCWMTPRRTTDALVSVKFQSVRRWDRHALQ